MLRLKPYLLTLVSLVVLDALWLSLMLPRFYRPRMDFLWQGTNIAPVIIFYPLFPSA